MKVRFIYQNHCPAWSFLDEIAQLVLGRNTGGRIVRIADVNQASLCSSHHFRQIMRKAAGQRHLYNIGAIGAGVE